MPTSKTCGRTCRKRKLKRFELNSVSKTQDNLFMLTKWMGENGFKPIKKMKPKIFEGNICMLAPLEKLISHDTFL